MGEVTIAFLVFLALVLLVALGIDMWDRHNGHDPKRRAEMVKTRAEHRRTVRTQLRSNRLGVGDNLEAQFQPPPDDHDIRPERRRKS